MENKNNIPKIGIFGWTGTGKTIYISMIHYLFSEKKHSHIYNSHILNVDDNTDNYDIEHNVDIFLEDENWESVTNKIKGSINTSNLLFEIDTEKGSRKFEIQDYRGEDIEKQEDKESEEAIYNYFLTCNALLLFLDAEAFEEKESLANRNRWREFQRLLHKLKKNNQSKKVKIPIYLVVTKKDILEFDNDGEIITSSSSINDKHNDMLRTISKYTESSKPYFISSKSCFDYYIKNNGKEESIAHEFCAPILRGLREAEINQKNQQKEIDYLNEVAKQKEEIAQIEKQREEKKEFTFWIYKKIGIGVLGLIFIYTLFFLNYNSTLMTIKADGSDVEELERFLAETPFTFIPSLKVEAEKLLKEERERIVEEERQKKIKIAEEKRQERAKLLQEIRESAKVSRKYKTTLSLIEIFKEKKFSYDNTEFLNIQITIKLYLIQEIQDIYVDNENKLKFIKDFNDISSLEEVRSKISPTKYNNLREILKDAKIVNKIKLKDSKNYIQILPLCKEYNSKPKYFGNMIKRSCLIAQEAKDDGISLWEAIFGKDEKKEADKGWWEK